MGRASMRRQWAVGTATAAALVTACDAVLLQQSKSYFTGGFLAVDVLTGPVDVAGFLLTSLAVDTAFIGLLSAVIASALRVTHLHPRARLFAGIVISTAGLVAADVVSYGILRYLGDVFDLDLMFDLTGRSVSEILAVSSTHLVVPLLLVAAAVAAIGASVWLVNRRYRGIEPTAQVTSLLGPAVVVALVGLVIMTSVVNASDTLENGVLRKPAGRVMASVVRQATDTDRDGFGMVGRSADPEPWNAAVFPYAQDVPGNGVDENGVGGDLPLAESGYDEPVPSGQWQQRPDVVLIVLESFRADVVGARTGDQLVTPVLDALARRGAAVDRAYSHNGYTVQSRHHLFTGSLLAVPTESTIIDDFLSHGYRVGYFSGQDESFGGAAYDVGFKRAHVAYDARADRARRYSTATTPGSLAVSHALLQERVTEFLTTEPRASQPLFLYVNFHDTHFPYTHREIEPLTTTQPLARSEIRPETRAALWQTYLNTAANVDRAIGRVLDAVQRSRDAAPVVIVTADHGESLYDEGFLGHGYALNDVQTRIPLLVANLAATLPAPFAQSDLRSVINTALQQPASQPGMPRVRHDANREIFQYLGDLARPRQIAFVRSDGRLIYDFRSVRVQLPDGQWMRERDLPEAWRRPFLRLIHKWEALALARGKRQAPTIEE